MDGSNNVEITSYICGQNNVCQEAEENSMKNSKNTLGCSWWLDSIIAFALVSGIMTVLYGLKGYAPFGEISLACSDANIQYLDFYSYLKDVLAGENRIIYSFGKVLGGTNIAVFSYYLSSPFSLLVAFFDKMQLHTFFDLIVLLKLAVSAAAFSVFLNGRFEKRLGGGTSCIYHSAVSQLCLVTVQYCPKQQCDVAGWRIYASIDSVRGIQNRPGRKHLETVRPSGGLHPGELVYRRYQLFVFCVLVFAGSCFDVGW